MINKPIKIKQVLTLRKDNFKITIPKNTEIFLVHSIAGKGSSCKFYDSPKKTIIYGGNQKNWSKNKGYIFLNKWLIELHWIQNNEVGKFEYKIKDYIRLQSKSFFYDFIEEKSRTI